MQTDRDARPPRHRSLSSRSTRHPPREKRERDREKGVGVSRECSAFDSCYYYQCQESYYRRSFNRLLAARVNKEAGEPYGESLLCTHTKKERQ
jgi:hypothetical protein